MYITVAKKLEMYFFLYEGVIEIKYGFGSR
jgi:hypothetical protein